MNAIKPILPCPSIKDQVSFYESLGFATVQVYTRPSPYAVVRYGALELHFYGTKRIPPNENSQMCYIEVDDVNRVHEEFASGLKRHLGKVPRTGIPRISQLKHLAEDRRFMMTDPGGNTFYIGTPNPAPAFYRTLESQEYAQRFEILYDLLYSKEDSLAALRMLEKFFPADVTSLQVDDLDLAKILLVTADIQLQCNLTENRNINDTLLKLLAAHDSNNPDWHRISNRYREIGGEYK